MTARAGCHPKRCSLALVHSAPAVLNIVAQRCQAPIHTWTLEKFSERPDRVSPCGYQPDLQWLRPRGRQMSARACEKGSLLDYRSTRVSIARDRLALVPALHRFAVCTGPRS